MSFAGHRTLPRIRIPVIIAGNCYPSHSAQFFFLRSDRYLCLITVSGIRLIESIPTPQTPQTPENHSAPARSADLSAFSLAA
jgi:hypothetical protein